MSVVDGAYTAFRRRQRPPGVRTISQHPAVRYDVHRLGMLVQDLAVIISRPGRAKVWRLQKANGEV